MDQHKLPTRPTWTLPKGSQTGKATFPQLADSLVCSPTSDFCYLNTWHRGALVSSQILMHFIRRLHSIYQKAHVQKIWIEISVSHSSDQIVFVLLIVWQHPVSSPSFLWTFTDNEIWYTFQIFWYFTWNYCNSKIKLYENFMLNICWSFVLFLIILFS